MNNVLEKKYSRERYHSWKTKAHLPRGDICLKMADLLHASFRYLITGEETEKDVLQDQFLKHKSFLESLDNLSDKDLEILEKIIFAFEQKSENDVK